MARIVVFRGKGPIPVGDPPVYICGCGLTKAYPYCTGAHIRVQDEDDKVYAYDRDGNRMGKTIMIRLGTGELVSPEALYSVDKQSKA